MKLRIDLSGRLGHPKLGLLGNTLHDEPSYKQPGLSWSS